MEYQEILDAAWGMISATSNKWVFEPVSSSNLAAAAYDRSGKVLVVAFLDGSVYMYADVPLRVWNGLMRAESHGSYFYWNVRLSFEYARID